ncbi:MAG: hypothetical protein EON56_01305 [Alphaproteobacteria bacterium]|nr:MAG: hypothetical protein EON56_01305 [Alphaproteobacteria bacterium]
MLAVAPALSIRCTYAAWLSRDGARNTVAKTLSQAFAVPAATQSSNRREFELGVSLYELQPMSENLDAGRWTLTKDDLSEIEAGTASFDVRRNRLPEAVLKMTRIALFRGCLGYREGLLQAPSIADASTAALSVARQCREALLSKSDIWPKACIRRHFASFAHCIDLTGGYCEFACVRDHYGALHLGSENRPGFRWAR